MALSRLFAGLFSMGAVLSLGCATVTPDVGEEAPSASVESATKIDCSYVKCAMPLCASGQHLVQNEGTCCPTCVGRPSRCAAVTCAAVMCADGEQRVYSNGDCCGRCTATPAAKECTTADDCPQLQCFACPCPVSSCRGGQCVTSTPDASTCGGSP